METQKSNFQFTLPRMFWALTLFCLLAFVVSLAVHAPLEFVPWLLLLACELLAVAVATLAVGSTQAAKRVIVVAIAIGVAIVLLCYLAYLTKT